MILNDKFYRVLKFIAQILLPALGALYFGLAEIWGLPKATEVVGTVTVVDTFLGIVLGLSSVAYNRSDAKYDGQIIVQDTSNGPVYAIQFDTRSDAESAKHKKELLLKI